jgi:hypothetical protein
VQNNIHKNETGDRTRTSLGNSICSNNAATFTVVDGTFGEYSNSLEQDLLLQQAFFYGRSGGDKK